MITRTFHFCLPDTPFLFGRKGLMSLLLSLLSLPLFAQTTETYVNHSSGLVLAFNAEKDRGVIVAPGNSIAQKLTLVSNTDGTCGIACTMSDGSHRFLALTGSWNTTFQTDSTADEARFNIESTDKGQFIRLRCKKNGKYLGTDNANDGSSVYADKSGSDAKHWWYLAEQADEEPETFSANYIVNVADRLQPCEGWGVSLCWWANMCGKWDDKKIDQIVEWLVSPTGLNYNIFRYNIGGGDDPLNRHCTLHHMGKGKGLRAEMEGFKDSTEDVYHWERDAAQRKIMLKIRERRPDAIFEAFSNSAPYYMTYSGCVAGNVNGGDDNLRPEYYEEFAHYLVDVCQHYRDEYGIEFKTLEPFNEPNTNYWHADGGQEGCHFGFDSQIAFLRVLAPILEESGLNTIIAASDETSVGTSVAGYKEYQRAGVLKLVDQWNTHTYSASNTDRAQIGSLARSDGKRLWMSEVGSGGSGIGGNLSLMQKLIDDIRYIMPTAWIDWQYVEENGDQWCTVRGNFANQTFERVKSYYIHQHFTRFIQAGYTFVNSLNAQTLAAVNEAADTLVLVALNNDATSVHHRARILFAEANNITAYMTTSSQNLSRYRKFELDSDGILDFELPSQSIVTFLIPLTNVAELPEDVQPDVPYLILPQYNPETALTADASGNVVLGAVSLDSAQVWSFIENGKGYQLQNALGASIRATTSYALKTSTTSATTLTVLPVEDYFWRIMTSSTKGLDLESAKYTVGTVVGQYEYGSSASAGHRHWHLMRLPSSPIVEDAIYDMPDVSSRKSESTSRTIRDLSGRRITHPTRGLYIMNGKKWIVR